MCSSSLANFFIEKSNKESIKITNLKLQKLMFIGYGWTLAVLDKDLTDNEPFQAWQHGPVLPSIYHEMKRYRDAPIQTYAIDYDSDENKSYTPKISDEQIISVLDKVWDIYKDFSAWSLRNLTHEKDSPWDKAYSEGKFIEKDSVKKYYENYLNRLLSDS